MRNKFFDKALKKAETMIENQQFISNLLDEAFVKLGGVSDRLYDVQDQMAGVFRMLRAWVKRDYRELSPTAVISVLAAVIYFMNPLDLITDFIPVIGFLDDIMVIGYVVAVFNKEIERFMVWEQKQQEHHAQKVSQA